MISYGNDSIKAIDNDMSPRFGHTITMGNPISSNLFLIQYTKQKQFYLEVQQALMENSQLTPILMSTTWRIKHG